MIRVRSWDEIINESGLEIAKMWPIRAWDHSPGGGTWTLPGMSTIEGFPTLWLAMRQIVKDWQMEASKYDFRAYQAADGDLDRTSYMFEALDYI